MAAKPKKSAAAVEQPVEAVEEPAQAVKTTAVPAAVGETPIPSAKYDDLAEIGRQNLSAVMEANEALSEGLEAISKEIASYARTSFEQAGHTATALLAAKTLEEVLQLNTDIARGAIETLLKRSAKLSEMSMSVATQTLAPLGSRVEAAIALATKYQAA